LILLCRAAELGDPGTHNIVLGEGEDELDVVLVKTNGVIHAYINCCPHQFIPLETFPNHFLTTDRRHLVCSGHCALFELATGICTRGPCAGESLHRLRIAERDGAVYLDETLSPAEIARAKRANRRW
jgi:nitrite reductase/ring-hydroxylating ferredoxin subunit